MKNENYLEYVPKRVGGLNWIKNESDIVTLEIENKGVINRIFQKFFRKPKISYIHLDEMGSFIWELIDGEKSIAEIGEYVKDHFGDSANPLYERLAKYLEILKSYNFIEWNK